MRFCKVYHAYLGLRGTPVRIQHVKEICFAYILRSSDIPVKRIIIMMLTSIFFEKNVSTEKNQTISRIELMTSSMPSLL
jgi:hypothetical protein